MKNYHSVLREEKPGLIPTGHYKIGKSIAFVHDIMKGLPGKYWDCDILYAEIPWRQGYEKYNKRARIEIRKYEDFIYMIKEVADSTDIIMVIVDGKEIARKLVFSQALKVTLNGYGSLALVFNGKLDKEGIPEGIDVEDLLGILAQRYDRIGDFNCGYGNSGRIFLEHGKTFVMSDINPKCIGYISENIK